MATYPGTPDSDTISGSSDADTIYGYNPQGGGNGFTIQTSTVATGIDKPTYVIGDPTNADRLYILEKTGTVKMMSLSQGQASVTTAINLTAEVDDVGERGLSGFAFHPQFGQNGNRKVYLTMSNNEGKTELREYSLDENGALIASSMNLVLKINQYTEASALHRAGWIGFGPGGYLYMTTGEGNQPAAAQDPTSLLGKVLRLDVTSGRDAYPNDPDKNFNIPDTNPTQFDGVPGTYTQSEVYAIGFRNPWRASFDANGRMFIGDVGENEYEEINLLQVGGNYGWGHSGPLDDGPESSNSPYTNPIDYYANDKNTNVPADQRLGNSVTGGYVYDGPVAALKGRYIYVDWGSGRFFTLSQNGDQWQRTEVTSLIFGDETGAIERINSFGKDAQGNIYVVTHGSFQVPNTGTVIRLTPHAVPTTDQGDVLNGERGNDIIYGGGGDDTIHGGNDNDHLYGEADDDQLYGDDGKDTLEGGAGNDIYYVDGSDTIVEDASSTDIDKAWALESFTLQAGQGIEWLEAAEEDSKDALDLTGNKLSQFIKGNAGANILNGNGGKDELIGLGGDDTYIVDGDDSIMEMDGGGTDTVRTTVSLDFSSDPDSYKFVENLTLLDTAKDGTGNELDNIIIGNNAANVLNGYSGEDTLEGRDGNDTYWIDDTQDVIVEDAAKGTDTIMAMADYALTDEMHVEIMRAVAGNDVDLTGNKFGNTFYGNAGDNAIDGRGGEDTVVFTGGRNDYTITRVAENSYTITDDKNRDGTDRITGVEFFNFNGRLIQAASLLNTDPTDIKLVGDAVQENTLTGRDIGTFSATDTAGDNLSYQLTNDAGGRFKVDAKTGVLEVADGVRLDYEQARSHTIEVRITDQDGGTATKIFVIGIQDQSDENATGSALGDLILGGAGRDTFSGGGGDDTLNAGASHDRLNGDAGNDSLVGGAGNDVFSGGDGSDRMIGGTGKDTFTGGKGRDVFMFDDRETGSSKTKADYITDFRGKEGDKLDLRAVDANTKKSGDQNFSFIGTKGFSKAGQVRYEKTKKETYVYLNTDNDKAAEAVIKLKGAIDLSKSWFVL